MSEDSSSPKKEKTDKNQALPSERLARNRNIILGIIVVGTLMGAVDSTIVLLAFPTITARLHSNFITSLWIILAYLLVLAATTTQFGRQYPEASPSKFSLEQQTCRAASRSSF